MDKILNFKKEVLTLDISAMIDFYPGNPYYIGKEKDDELRENINKSTFENYEVRLDKSDYEVLKELASSDEIYHCYVITMSEAMLNNIYVEAQFSIGSLSLDRLKYEFQKFESYNYEKFFAELDFLSSRFTNNTTDSRDKHRFKAVFKKHFKYSTPIVGKITGLFISSLRSELKLRVKYLELLKEDIKQMIAIKMESLSNNVAPIINNTMEIDYNEIFNTAVKLAEDPTGMKSYCIRQQKKARRDHYFEKDEFYKGLLKFAVDEREKIKSFLSLANETLNVTSPGWYIPIIYTHEEIDLIENIIHEICKEDKNEPPSQLKYTEDTTPQNSHKAEPELKIKDKKERDLKNDKLKLYFTAQFKGMGHNDNDYEKLIKELEAIIEESENKRIGKKIAQIALMIYNSEKINARKPKSFAEWHRELCDCIGTDYKEYYPSKLEPFPKQLKDLFIYLF